MPTVTGVKTGATCIYKEAFAGNGTREAWLVTASFTTYTAASDDAELTLVGAYIDSIARDGKTSTLRGGIPVLAMDNGSGTGVYFSGASVQALSVSSDTLAGELNNAALTETNSATNTGAGIIVIVDRA
jgi:hypothetical protein